VYSFDKPDLMKAANEGNNFNKDKKLEQARSNDWITYHSVHGLDLLEKI
jgi:hypothetical protein